MDCKVIYAIFVTLGCMNIRTTDGALNYFDCQRNDHTCIGAACVGPHCGPCPAAKKGYDCAIQYQVSEDNSRVECLCQNGGTCYKNSNVFKCSCPPRFYGNKCENDRSFLECSPKCMMIGINPIGNNAGDGSFRGKVTASSTGICNFIQIGSGNPPPAGTNLEGYYLNVCENDNMCPFIIVGDVMKINVTIQYGSDVFNQHDSFISFQCKQTGIVQLVHHVGVNAPPPEYSQISGQFTPTKAQIPVTINAVRYGQVVTTLPFWVPFNLTLEVNIDSGYSALLVESLVAQNTIGNRVHIISDKCRHTDAVKVMSENGQKRFTSNKVIVGLRSFFLGDIYKLSFIANVVVCVTDLDPRCTVPSCTQAQRRRRDTSSNIKEYGVNVTLLVLPPTISDRNTGSTVATVGDDVVLVIGIVCGCFFLSVFTALVVIGVMWTRWKKNKLKSEIIS